MTCTALHRFGPAACARVAFFYDDEDAPLDMIEAQRVTLPDGSKPQPGDTMTCGACGAKLSPAEVDLLPGELHVRAKR